MQEVLKRDRKLLYEAASFLTDVVIPRMLRECIQLSLVPTDGESLKVAMHSRGINMRYLGRVAKLASSRYDLDHLTVSEVFIYMYCIALILWVKFFANSCFLK